MSMSDAYRRSAADFVVVVEGLSDEQLAQPVPACPDWSVQDLLAHLAGESADVVSGNLDGVTTDPWTQQQVADRRDRSAAGLVSEWQGNLDAVAHTADVTTGPNPAWDVAVHLADLREAVGLEPAPPKTGWGEVFEAARGMFATTAGTVSLAEEGPDPGTTTWHLTTAYGLWRAMFSRLDRAALEREVLRGDVDALAASAFL